jgi:hypothetical protein
MWIIFHEYDSYVTTLYIAKILPESECLYIVLLFIRFVMCNDFLLLNLFYFCKSKNNKINRLHSFTIKVLLLLVKVSI